MGFNFPLALGILLIGHAAFSATHFKSLIDGILLPSSILLPPLDVYIEALGFVLSLIGVVMDTPALQPISLSEDPQLREEFFEARPEFLVFPVVSSEKKTI